MNLMIDCLKVLSSLKYSGLVGIFHQLWIVSHRRDWAQYISSLTKCHKILTTCCVPGCVKWLSCHSLTTILKTDNCYYYLSFSGEETEVAQLESSKAEVWTWEKDSQGLLSIQSLWMLPCQKPGGRTQATPAAEVLPTLSWACPNKLVVNLMCLNKILLNIWIDILKENKKCENK